MSIKEGYIRVSEILSQWNRFGKIKKEVLEHKAEIGTNVHEAIKAHQQGYSFPLEEGRGYFDSFYKWYFDTSFETIYFGTRFYCERLFITGEVDSIIRFPHSKKLVLIDFKTSASQDELFWQLQGQFYHYLCTQAEIELDDKFMFIQLDKEGKMPKVHTFKSSSSLMNVCMSAYICYKYLNRIA